MLKPLRALVVEDSNDDAVLMARELERGGFEVTWTRVETEAQLLAALEQGSWDILLSDYSLPGFGAPQALDVLRRSGLDLPCIVVSGSISEEATVELMRLGADDYILKDSLTWLPPAVERELRDAANRRETRRAADRHRLLIEAIPHIVWMATADGAITYLSRAGVDTFGVPPETLYGSNWVSIVHPDDLASVQEVRNRGIQSRESYSLEARLRRRDGSFRWHVSRAVPIPDSQGQAGGWVGTLTDIHEQKESERALRASEERFRQIAENIREVFWLTDPGWGEMAYVSPAYDTIWGRSRSALYASPREWIDAIHPEDRARVIDAAQTRQATGEYEEEYRVVRPDGSVRWIRDRAFPVRDASGQVIRVAGVAEDITERRDLEVQLRQAQKMEAIGQLAAGVAHDFNNLLTVITGYGDMLVELFEPGDPKREMVDEIREAGARSVALTRQLLAFSRKQMLVPKVFDLNGVVRDAERVLRRVIGEDVQLVTTLHATSARITADQGQLEQVLLNLAVNARDAMPDGGRLSIETIDLVIEPGDPKTRDGFAPGRYALLTLSDTGVGMSDEVKRHVFEPFFTTKGPAKGTGLGLAVVHGFVKQSQGHIEFDSKTGRGTTFRIYLPNVDQPLAASTAGDASSSRGTQTILLVEDEEGVRALARRILQGHGYTVVEVADGASALRVAAAHRGMIDLLVTDVVMPGLNGRALAEQLVALHPSLKVLYMSGYTDDAAVRHGIQQDDVNFLPKPFTPAGLVRKVRSVLTR